MQSGRGRNRRLPTGGVLSMKSPLPPEHSLSPAISASNIRVRVSFLWPKAETVRGRYTACPTAPPQCWWQASYTTQEFFPAASWLDPVHSQPRQSLAY